MIDKKLRRLKDYFGTYSALADELGISPQAINEWRVKGVVPAGAAIEIERITGGEITAVWLTE